MKRPLTPEQRQERDYHWVRRFVVAALVWVAVALGVLGWVAGARGATTVVSPNPIYQRWVDEAKVPTPETTVTVETTDSVCPTAALACTSLSTIWVRPNPRLVRRQAFFHEVGHIFDYTLSDTVRSSAAKILRVPPWKPGVDPEADPFADAYAVCAIHRRITTWWIDLPETGRIGKARQRTFCGLVRSLASPY